MAANLRAHTGGPSGTFAHVDAALAASTQLVKCFKAAWRGTLVMVEIIVQLLNK